MSRECFVGWGAGKHESWREVHVMGLEEFDSLVDSIEFSAVHEECVYQVDLRLGDITLDDPILIQFMVGHPERSSLLWHEDGKTMAAVVEQIQPLTDGIEIEHPSGSYVMEPDYTRISPMTVREFLSLYLLTGLRPDNLQWVEAEQD